MFVREKTEILREVLGSFNEHDLDAIMSFSRTATNGLRVERGMRHLDFRDDGKIVRKDSFWKIREA